MKELVTYTKREGVAVIAVDNPPVNAMSPGVPEGIAAALDRAAADEAVDAIVLMGAGRTFIAGADIKVLQEIAWGGGEPGTGFHDLLARIENSAKPVVMAIHGSALGGGLEVAMAGHYRVAAPEAQLGQPEVNLGIIPGAEGTQRLPRLVGVEKAIEMCVTGKPVKAPEALAAGLIDAMLHGDIAEGAVAFARRAAGPHPKTCDRNEKLGTAKSNEPLFAAGRQLAAKIKRNQKAPLRAVDAIEIATRLPFAEGCRREREIFAECIHSDQAKALIHAFFAERGAAKLPDVSRDTATYPVARIAIVGAGTMGGGIAMACANAGLAVILKETAQDALDSGVANIRRNYETQRKPRPVHRGGGRQENRRHPAAARLRGVRRRGSGHRSGLRKYGAEEAVFAEIDHAARPGCILATNTSTLDIDEIASATSRPEAVIGMHFFSPANVMRLLEIVRGKATAREVIATAMAVARQLKKVGVVVGNCQGFVGNRMFFPYLYEAHFLAEDGATPEQVDRALTNFGMAMGTFAVDDLAGIDVAWRVRQELGHFQEPGVRKPLVQEQLYAMGRWGQKKGKGWHSYGADRKAVPDPEVVALIERTAAAAGIERRIISDQEIVERSVYALINEGARVLEEGYALRAADIDVVYLNGYGFPPWRGGPMFYADQVGLGHICKTVERFRRDLGQRWEPAPLLQRLAAEGRTFREYDRLAGRVH